MKKIFFVFILFTNVVFSWSLVKLKVYNPKYVGKTSAITYVKNAYLRADKLPDKSNFILYMGDIYNYDETDGVYLTIYYGKGQSLKVRGFVWPYSEMILSIFSIHSEKLDKILEKENKITIETTSKTGKVLKATFDTSGYKEIKKKMKIGGDYD